MRQDRYVQSLLSSVEARLGRIERAARGDPRDEDDDRAIRKLIRQMERLMPTLDETLAKVTEQGDRLDSLIAFVDGLKKQIEEKANLTPEQQAQVDAIFAEAEENSGKIDRALNVNVPPATPVDTQ